MNKQINVCGDSPLFNEYLQAAGYSTKTIEAKRNKASNFTKWCKKRGTTPIIIDYKTCLKYIEYLKQKGNSKKTINHKLTHLRNYFDHLSIEGHRMDNPIENTVIRGEKTRSYYTILEAEELEDLYYSFETDTILRDNAYNKMAAKRDKAVVGLLVYQGLDSKDFRGLRLEHLKLRKGKLYVPGRRRSNARTLELKPWQVIELMEYIDTVRPVILTKVKNPVHHEQIFPYGQQFTLTGLLVKKLKKYNHKVTSAMQIRTSVITHWLEQHNLRTVQYMAGHKHISSTEKYMQDDLENLHEIVNNFHPIS